MSLPRGISPELLIDQIRNTMPYLFSAESLSPVLEAFQPRIWMEEARAQILAGKSLSHVEYFRLCLSAHFLTCGTPVPTDVDNQIRHKLWPRALSLETVVEMTEIVLRARKWNFTAVAQRHVAGAAGSPWEKELLSGHLGEWFTVASGAYGALGHYAASEALALRERLLEKMGDEVHRHSEIFGSLWRSEDGLGCLKASASIAHNFGDLDRVMEMWEVPVNDPLRLRFYGLTATPFGSDGKLRYLGRLWTAGELYKSSIEGSSMAMENHRHFALRKPRPLRRSPDYLLPNGPFFDDWGKAVCRGLAPEGEVTSDLEEVIESLIQGWSRLPGTVGYGRALAGMMLNPSVRSRIETDPAVKKSSASRTVLSLSQGAFERRWSSEALRLLEEIPSRA